MTEESTGFKALYPKLNAEELAVAKDNLDRYLALAWEIFEDSRLEVESRPLPGFPESSSRGNIQERSIANKPKHLPNI